MIARSVNVFKRFLWIDWRMQNSVSPIWWLKTEMFQASKMDLDRSLPFSFQKHSLFCNYWLHMKRGLQKNSGWNDVFKDSNSDTCMNRVRLERWYECLDSEGWRKSNQVFSILTTALKSDSNKLLPNSSSFLQFKSRKLYEKSIFLNTVFYI